MKSTTYLHAIERVIRTHAQAPGHGRIEAQVLYDPAQARYLLLHVGWNGTRRVHSVILDLRIEHDNVVIEHDGLMTVPGLTEELTRAGVAARDIVASFWQPVTPLP